jgi:hypothetical protein
MKHAVLCLVCLLAALFAAPGVMAQAVASPSAPPATPAAVVPSPETAIDLAPRAGAAAADLSQPAMCAAPWDLPKANLDLAPASPTLHGAQFLTCTPLSCTQPCGHCSPGERAECYNLTLCLCDCMPI